MPPAEATEANLWWDQFLGEAPKKPFTPQRFFAWRNWSDYGTGLAGDLFVHVLASIHYITGCNKPLKVYSDGDILYYKDGSRDTPDLIYSLFDYAMPQGANHFKMSLGANVLDGISNSWGSTDFNMVGLKGAMRVNWDAVQVKTTAATAVAGLEQKLQAIPGFGGITKISDNEYRFTAKAGYPDAHFLHFQNFFDAARNGTKNIAPVEFGVNASAAALMSFESQMKIKLSKYMLYLKNLMKGLPLLILFLSFGSLAVHGQHKIEKRVYHAFDGRNMDAWTGNTTEYVLEDGCIVMKPTQEMGGNLYSKQAFSDFILRFDFYLTPGANNGLGIRHDIVPNDKGYAGMELQILIMRIHNTKI